MTGNEAGEMPKLMLTPLSQTTFVVNEIAEHDAEHVDQQQEEIKEDLSMDCTITFLDDGITVGSFGQVIAE